MEFDFVGWAASETLSYALEYLKSVPKFFIAQYSRIREKRNACHVDANPVFNTIRTGTGACIMIQVGAAIITHKLCLRLSF